MSMAEWAKNNPEKWKEAVRKKMRADAMRAQQQNKPKPKAAQKANKKAMPTPSAAAVERLQKQGLGYSMDNAIADYLDNAGQTDPSVAKGLRDRAKQGNSLSSAPLRRDTAYKQAQKIKADPDATLQEKLAANMAAFGGTDEGMLKKVQEANVADRTDWAGNLDMEKANNREKMEAVTAQVYSGQLSAEEGQKIYDKAFEAEYGSLDPATSKRKDRNNVFETWSRKDLSNLDIIDVTGGKAADYSSEYVDPGMEWAAQLAVAIISGGVGSAVGGALGGSGLLSGAGKGLAQGLTQGALTRDFDVRDIAAGTVTGGFNEFTKGFGPNSALGSAIKKGGGSLIEDVIKGEGIDLEGALKSGAIAGGSTALKDYYQDAKQTGNIHDLQREFEATQGMSPEEARKAAEAVHRTSDFGKLFGKGNTLDKIGIDTGYISTKPLNSFLDFIKDPMQAIQDPAGLWSGIRTRDDSLLMDNPEFKQMVDNEEALKDALAKGTITPDEFSNGMGKIQDSKKEMWDQFDRNTGITPIDPKDFNDDLQGQLKDVQDQKSALNEELYDNPGLSPERRQELMEEMEFLEATEQKIYYDGLAEDARYDERFWTDWRDKRGDSGLGGVHTENPFKDDSGGEGLFGSGGGMGEGTGEGRDTGKTPITDGSFGLGDGGSTGGGLGNEGLLPQGPADNPLWDQIQEAIDSTDDPQMKEALEQEQDKIVDSGPTEDPFENTGGGDNELPPFEDDSDLIEGTLPEDEGPADEVLPGSPSDEVLPPPGDEVLPPGDEVLPPVGDTTIPDVGGDTDLPVQEELPPAVINPGGPGTAQASQQRAAQFLNEVDDKLFRLARVMSISGISDKQKLGAAVAIRELLRQKQQAVTGDITAQVDPETGEIIKGYIPEDGEKSGKKKVSSGKGKGLLSKAAAKSSGGGTPHKGSTTHSPVF